MYKQLKMYGDMVRLVKQYFPEHLDATHLQLAKVADLPTDDHIAVVHCCAATTDAVLELANTNRLPLGSLIGELIGIVHKHVNWLSNSTTYEKEQVVVGVLECLSLFPL